MTRPIDWAGDQEHSTIKLIGVGQSLRGDDAAGLAAVRLWKELYQANGAHQDCQAELAELPGLNLISLLEGARLTILVDAVRSGELPGKIFVVPAEQLKSFGDGADSAHGFGVAETLALGQKLMPEAMPEHLFVIGIEAGELNVGSDLSPEVQQVLPEVASLIEQLITAW